MATTPVKAVTTATAPTSTLVTALDMLENFNWAQLGDAIESFATEPVTAVEDVANIAVQAATVAGVPFAGTVGAMLPVIEGLFSFLNPFVSAFGGTSGAAAVTSTAISSPPALTSAALVTPPVGTAGVKPTGIV